MRRIQYSRHREIGRGYFFTSLFQSPKSLRHSAGLFAFSTRRIWNKRTISTESKDDSNPDGQRQSHQQEDGEDSSSPIKSNSSDKQSATTLTSQERKTFDRIFRDICSTAQTSKREVNGQQDDDISFAFGPGTTTDEKMMDQQESPETSLVLSYPEPLRAAAAETIRKVQKLAQYKAQVRREKAMREAHPLLDPVIKRMRNAKTDRDLWAVLEKEVFSVVRLLDGEGGGKEEPKEEQVKKRTRRRWRRRLKGVGLVDVQITESSKNNLPLLKTIGPSYPHLLLVAMRIFRDHFRLPSACLALFAHVRSLGPISYVLGGTTALYNEVIRIKWRSYGDFYGIDELLAEMEKGGVEFDQDTLSVLREIMKERRRVSKGGEGSVMRDLWNLDGIQEALLRVARWKGIVSQRLIENAIATGMVVQGQDRRPSSTSITDA